MKRFSYASHLECSRCGRKGDVSKRTQTCACGSPMWVRYDLPGIASAVTKEEVASRPQNLWRYHEWLPVADPASIVSLHESMTPLIPLSQSGADMDIDNLIVKDEGVLPSGTFKARGASVGISKAKELGVEALAIPTNGNAGAAWALYAARAGIRATVIMPDSAPMAPRKECVIAGAELYVISGTIGDAGRIVARACAKHGWYDVSTLKEPFRLEGKKTMGLEIAEQFGWSVPDVIVYPTGGGAGVIGIYKGLRELQEMGWIGPKLPRIAIVQAEGCAPLVRAFNQGDEVSQEWKDPHTVAFGMRVPKALGDFLILDVLRQTGGAAITVTDQELTQERAATVARDGLHVCPEGAAALAGARKLRASGYIKEGERVLVMNTGSGLKYVDQIEQAGIPLELEAVL
ncbi:MAG: threonine synthase [Firmicutes bacterium]|nr:threonine synthase [Bacillota bacterium]